MAEMGWAKFWATFSQTHLVTLVGREEKDFLRTDNFTLNAIRKT
jgi:hypothetical protein